MIRNLLKIGLLLIVAILVYNRFFGTTEEQKQAKGIFKSVGNVFVEVGQLVSAEKDKFDAGKYDGVLDKLGGAYRAIREQAENVDGKIIKRLDELERRKAALQTELDSIESIDQQIQSAPAAPKKGIKADPKAEQNQAAKTADQQRRKAELQRQLEQLIKDSDALIKQAQEE
ncbi:MAG: hypothetical protein JNL02_00090 [Saprospiraceae bacterium]|nr:hypothetical protein [Saprospiraceae bacterium]